MKRKREWEELENKFKQFEQRLELKCEQRKSLKEAGLQAELTAEKVKVKNLLAVQEVERSRYLSNTIAS